MSLDLNFWSTTDVRSFEQLTRDYNRLKEQFKELNQRHAAVEHTKQTLPWIFVITPTYSRPVQKAELTRLAQTLLHVRHVHWIVVEDRDNKTRLVSRLLSNSGLLHSHLVGKTPAEDKLQDSDPNWLKPRGVLQRNAALEWLRDPRNNISRTGVVYFADDDNTYDYRLFKEVSKDSDTHAN